MPIALALHRTVAGFLVGELLVVTGVPDPGSAVAAALTWFAIPAAVVILAVKGL